MGLRMRFHQVLRIAALAVVFLLFSFSAFDNDDPADIEEKKSAFHDRDSVKDQVVHTPGKFTRSPVAGHSKILKPSRTPKPPLKSLTTSLMPVSSSSSRKPSTISDSTTHTVISLNASSTDFSSGTIEWSTDALSATSQTVKDSFHISQVQASTSFKDDYCVIDDEEWLPRSNSSNAWQLRTPYVIFPGAKSSGLPSILNRLRKHPSVSNPPQNELRFFFTRNFMKFLTVPDHKVRVQQARQRMWTRHYRGGKAMKGNPNLITFDATTGYLFSSATIPIRLFCVAPWTKIVIVLRNPLDRAWAHHRELVNIGLRIPFSEWIQNDLDLMEEVGLMDKDGRIVVDDDHLWATYAQNSVEGPVGSGLYFIQLRHWLGALQALGRDFASSVLLIRYESWKGRPDETYRSILSFLGLPVKPQEQQDRRMQFLRPINETINEMSEETRSILENVYKPVNHRLYKMLDWDAVWE